MTRKGAAADPFAELLAAIPVLAGRRATPEDRRRFVRYLELLVQWNRVHGLTGLKHPHEIVRGLFLDSLLFLPQLPPRPLRLVDIGSGAGVPGLPLRIVDEGIDLTLLEARRKRVSFLSAVQRELGLPGITIVEGRAEQVINQDTGLKGKFDVAVARAITPTAKFLRSCEKYLRPGGIVIVAGPPAVQAAPRPGEGAEWTRLRFPRLGLERMFLITRLRET